MATNFFFNNYFASGEQRLMEDLVAEMIKQYGIDAIYIPRTVIARDDVFREQTTASFDAAVEVEMYIVDVQGFKGDGKFLSKFGLEIRDEMTFSVSMRTFADEVGGITNQKRPNEGDLIYLPLDGKVYQVKFVDHQPVFYQFGALQFFNLTCELFEYSNETFNTGYAAIDDKYNTFSTDMEPYTIYTEDGYLLTDESGNPLVNDTYVLDEIVDDAQNDEIQDEADNVLDWDERDPFSVGGRY